MEKLLDQYKKKVKDCDERLDFIKTSLSLARRTGDDDDVRDLLETRSSLRNERQIYFQFTKDLEDYI